jgi:U6 snRNA-associated Sm-like protein LSm8
MQEGEEKHPLEGIIGHRAKIIANDGRVFVGTLKGVDQALNCILSDAEERVYSEDDGVKVHPLGTYFIRGDTIVVLGEFEETEEEFEELSEVRGKPLGL